jgi:hypothetical protein
MAKMTEFVTPTGARGNLLSPSSWIQMILGVIVFLVAFAIGQNITQKASSKLPFDTTIDPIVKQPIVASATTAQVKEVY